MTLLVEAVKSSRSSSVFQRMASRALISASLERSLMVPISGTSASAATMRTSSSLS